MRFGTPAILALALILSPVAAQHGYILDQSRGVVLIYSPSEDTEISTVNAFQWSNNTIIQRAFGGTSPFQNQEYEVPYSYYLLPLMSQLSWIDSSGTVHVAAAVLATSGSADYVYFQSVYPHITVVFPEYSENTVPTSPYDLFQKLYGSTGKLCLVIVEDDPIALSYAFAEKWFMAKEAVLTIKDVYGVDVPPQDVDLCYVVCGSTAVPLSNGYLTSVLIPLVWGASAITSPQILTALADAGDPFATLVEHAACVFVVYSHNDFRYLVEQTIAPLLPGGAVMYLPASLEKIYDSSPEYVILSLPGPGGPGAWSSTGQEYPLYQPWIATLYLGSVLGIPFILTAQDLDLLGKHWKGVIIINPKPSEYYVWDEVSLFSSIIPQALNLGGEGFPNVLETTMQITMANGKSVNVAAPYFYGGARIVGLYPWDVDAINVTTDTLLALQGHPLHFEWTIYSPDTQSWITIAAAGPYCILTDAQNSPAYYAYRDLIDAIVSAVANARDDTWLKDVPMMATGLYGLFCLVTAIAYNDDPEILLEENRAKFFVGFGFIPLEDWVTYDKPVAFHVDWPNKDCLAVICRSSTSVKLNVPYDMASCCDVQAMLTEEPYDLEGVTSWYQPSTNPEYTSHVFSLPFLPPLPSRRRRR